MSYGHFYYRVSIPRYIFIINCWFSSSKLLIPMDVFDCKYLLWLSLLVGPESPQPSRFQTRLSRQQVKQQSRAGVRLFHFYMGNTLAARNSSCALLILPADRFRYLIQGTPFGNLVRFAGGDRRQNHNDVDDDDDERLLMMIMLTM